MSRPGEKLTGWWLHRVQASAKSELEPDESVIAAAYGQETKRQFTSFFCFWQARLFAATERNLYVFKAGSLNSAKIVKTLAKHSRDDTDVAQDGRALVLAGTVIWPPPGAGTETSQLLDYLAGAEQAAAVASAPTETRSVAPPGSSVPPPHS